MTVYEASSKGDYDIIAKFILSQRGSIPFACWQGGFKGEGHLVDSIERFKVHMPYLHIFWVEDEKGIIKVVISVHERMSIEKVPVATYAFVCVDQKDWETNNGLYFKELLDYIIRNEAPKYRLERGEFFGLEKYANWTKELCGNSMETVGKMFSAELGEIVHAYTIDFKKYLGMSI